MECRVLSSYAERCSLHWSYSRKVLQSCHWDKLISPSERHPVLLQIPYELSWWWYRSHVSEDWAINLTPLHCTLSRSIFLGSLGFCDVLLPFLFLLLLTVLGLYHLGEFPGQQGTGDEQRGQCQDNRGKKTIWIFGSPLHHIFCPCFDINHDLLNSSSALDAKREIQRFMT